MMTLVFQGQDIFTSITNNIFTATREETIIISIYKILLCSTLFRMKKEHHEVHYIIRYYITYDLIQDVTRSRLLR